MRLINQTITPDLVGHCTNILVTLFLDSGVEEIKTHSFSNFVLLKTVTFGPTVNNIENQAFYRIGSLTTLHFEMTECTCQPSAFLESFGIREFTAVDDSDFTVDCGALYFQTTIMKCPAYFTGQFSVRDDCTYIAPTAFATSSLDTLFLGPNVASIGYAAFIFSSIVTINTDRCDHLKTVDGVLYKDTLAIWFSTSRRGAVTLRDGTISGGQHLGSYCKLDMLILPSGFTTLLSYAFEACTNLKRIVCLGQFPSGISLACFARSAVRQVYLQCDDPTTTLPFTFSSQPTIQHTCTPTQYFTAHPLYRIRPIIALFSLFYCC